jgi:hypothetical protein
MPGRRPIKKGSFGAHFDEVVKHFPHAPLPNRQQRSNEDARAQQEKRDIHALLFERAWRLDGEHQDDDAR